MARDAGLFVYLGVDMTYSSGSASQSLSFIRFSLMNLPGEIVLTRIPSLPNSQAKFRAIWRTADLDVL